MEREPQNTEGLGQIDNPSLLPASFSSAAGTTSSTSRLSRDEMNLAEFPLTVLSKRVDPSVKTLEFHDAVRGKNGETIKREWIITGADKFGLPTSSDDEVLLGLLKLTADEGLINRRVTFTRYELLKILRWTTEGRSYTRLQNALDRLSGVRIKATNAFYDNESKLHSTRNFGIIDAYEINDGRDTRASFFTWSDVLFKSFQVGFIKKLDLNFYLDLQSAVTKRLYRYLDKHFWYRSRLQVNLFTLSHEKVGISRNYKYASSLRQQLEPALEELVNKGLLLSFEFLGKGASTDVIIIAAHGVKKPIQVAAENSHIHQMQSSSEHQTTLGTDVFRSQSSLQLQDRSQVDSDESQDLRERVKEELTRRGVVKTQAARLTASFDVTRLERTQAIIAYFDHLVYSKSHLVSRSPAGFLYRAVEKGDEFVLPQERRNENTSNTPLSKPKNSNGRSTGRHTTHEQLEIEYLKVRQETLDKLKDRVLTSEIETVRTEVLSALSKLQAHISPQRFIEAVDHAVDQRLLEAHGFSDFDTWVRDPALIKDIRR